MNSSSNIPIIQTKFCAPHQTTELVERPRLLSLLDGSLEVPLTLVSAPAGYGKSTLVSQWLQHREHSTIWISLDPADSSLHLFLSYLIAAIRNRFPDACETSEQLLQAPDILSAEAFSAYLLNDLDKLERPCSIVFDDYHHIASSSAVHELMERLLQHPAEGIHFVLITRRDPPLPLVSLRANSLLHEVRMRDLRFDSSETIKLLANSSDGFTPRDDVLANLQQQLEGWAVGLRLVSLALKHHKNPDDFLSSIQGGIPGFQEYLMQEVLSGLPVDVRNHLLRCSLLDRFCADLLNYIGSDEPKVSPGEGLSGADLIKQLELENLFTISLDGHSKWFRFHHSFQDFLKQELKRTELQHEISQVHMRASQWFESNGLVDDAIKHALLAGDAIFAARIVERHCYEELEADRCYVLERWLDQIPEDVKHQRPTLLVTLAWVATFKQQLATVDTLVGEFEQLMEQQGGHEDLLGEIDFFHGWLMFWQGDFDRSKHFLERAQSGIGRHKSMLIAEVDLHLSIGTYLGGQADAGMQLVNDQINAFGGLQMARRIAGLAFIHLLAGDLARLEIVARRMRRIDRKMRSTLTDAWSAYFSGCVELHRFDLVMAAQYFSGVADRPHLIDRRAAIDSFAALALAQQMMGRSEEADETLERLRNFVRETDDPENFDLWSSCENRVSLLQGKLAPAIAGQAASLTAPGVFDLFIWLDVPAITHIRLLIAEGSEASLEMAQQRLESVSNISESYHFTVQTIEIAVLQAVLLEKQGRNPDALDALGAAIELAEKGGWIRPFVEAGLPLAGLLRQFSEESGGGIFVHNVLAALDRAAAGTKPPVTDGLPVSATLLPGSPHEGLTNRELDILELLARRMQNKEIANKLFISTHTVKDHLKHIYQKLGVNNRRQAIAKAVEAGLVVPKNLS